MASFILEPNQKVLYFKLFRSVSEQNLGFVFKNFFRRNRSQNIFVIHHTCTFQHLHVHPVELFLNVRDYVRLIEKKTFY